MKIGIVVVAYNAASTLVQTLDRIPVDFRRRIEEIVICDDASYDGTFELGRSWASQAGAPPTHVIRHAKNLGYGGNQKAAYGFAIERALDVVILLHADGQYAPEVLPDFVDTFERTSCDAVFGSRMMTRGAARRGGMPLYKFLGNRILSRFENWVLGSALTEFHSGYRAYRIDALSHVPFMSNSNGFDFDTQIIAQLLGVGARIVEIPIPTYYGDEICYVNGFRYAWDVVRDIVEYRLASRGFGTPAWVQRPQYMYPRLRVALGLFGYDRLGILDQSHLRFFTRRSLARLVREAGFDIVEQRTTSVPFTALMGPSPTVSVAQKVGGWLAQSWPSLFAYQYVWRLTPHRGDTVHISNGHVPGLAPSASLTNTP